MCRLAHLGYSFVLRKAYSIASQVQFRSVECPGDDRQPDCCNCFGHPRWASRGTGIGRLDRVGGAIRRPVICSTRRTGPREGQDGEASHRTGARRPATRANRVAKRCCARRRDRTLRRSGRGQQDRNRARAGFTNAKRRCRRPVFADRASANSRRVFRSRLDCSIFRKTPPIRRASGPTPWPVTSPALARSLRPLNQRLPCPRLLRRRIRKQSPGNGSGLTG